MYNVLHILADILKLFYVNITFFGNLHFPYKA